MTEETAQTTTLRCFDIIENSAGFDAEWYAATFGDVAQTGLEARAHYEQFGFMLGRGVSAKAQTLQDVPGLREALMRRPKISYCIPIMNRTDDIRNTLAENLEANRGLEGDIEFLLVFADEDAATHAWVREAFAEELRTGYLRLIVLPPLDGWHFGVAKNLHRPFARGEVYSSLDGDNFVTRAETEQLLDVARIHQNAFVFHHFTGEWGDGSSGRISLPMSLYRALGYDTRFMPRQFDEMDVIISAMAADPRMPLLRLASNDKEFGSDQTKNFLWDAGIVNPVITLEPPNRRAPLNPKGSDYVGADPVLGAMTSFNKGLCFLKNAPSQRLRDEALRMTVAGRQTLIDKMPAEDILPTFFELGDHPDAENLDIGPSDVCVFACMKNDDGFLPDLYAHYKALGIARFFIVDDGSDTPIRQILPHSDVHVFRPKIGSFVTSKVLWMEGLMKAYLRPGQWALTVDADEFIDLPKRFASFADLVGQLDKRDQDHLPGLLIDMVPGPDADSAMMHEAERHFVELFDHYVSVPDAPDPAYVRNPSIAWGFGPYAGLSWQLDTRYHAFGTLDALRKIPLIKLRAGLHIDQGFHSLHYTDDTPKLDSSVWDTDLVLPIRHYKLVKLFSESARKRMSAQVSSARSFQYHARTAANIARIFGEADGAQLRTLMTLPSLPYQDSVLRRLNPSTYRQELRDLSAHQPPRGSDP